MNLIVALIVATSLLACYLATRTRDEMQYLEAPLRILQAIAGLALLAVFPWWLALVFAGALAIGGYVMVVAVGALAVSASGADAAIALPLALLAGARWELDKRNVRTYALLLGIATLVFAGLRLLNLF